MSERDYTMDTTMAPKQFYIGNQTSSVLGEKRTAGDAGRKKNFSHYSKSINFFYSWKSTSKT